ncbi:MAG: hypothetical protein CMO01_22670 [Thalassobius sp.]|nr:hypothetical protein [Thalassovita sp.]
MELIYENEYGKAEYDSTNKLLRTQYIGVAQAEPIIDLLRKVLPFAEKGKIRHMLANLTGMRGSFAGAMNFFETEFYPHMLDNGLETYAMAFSHDAMTKFAALQLNLKVMGKLDWHAFPSLDEAEIWTETKIQERARVNYI